MARKRVHALYPPLRAPDGSAFSKCELCGASVPIALADMHDCEEFNVKRRRKYDEWCGIQEEPDEKILLTITKESMISSEFRDQPRSPFCFFMEEFSRDFEGHLLIEVSQRGFETWKNMSSEERTRYDVIASKINVPYENKIRREETDVMGKVIDDEVNSSIASIRLCQHDEDLSESGSYSSYY
ncbi:HMG-box (high mobility group) DNA-binding family protein [Carex rostrata]